MRHLWGPWSRGIYPHGFGYGVLMSVCAYPLRNWDAPVPLVVAVCATPAFIASGFLVARRHGSEQGAAAGAAATATGHLIVFLTYAGYAAVNDSGLTGLGWALFGVMFLPVALIFGALWGWTGAALAHVLRIIGGHGHGQP